MAAGWMTLGSRLSDQQIRQGASPSWKAVAAGGRHEITARMLGQDMLGKPILASRRRKSGIDKGIYSSPQALAALSAKDSILWVTLQRLSYACCGHYTVASWRVGMPEREQWRCRCYHVSGHGSNGLPPHPSYCAATSMVYTVCTVQYTHYASQAAPTKHSESPRKIQVGIRHSVGMAHRSTHQRTPAHSSQPPRPLPLVSHETVS